MIELNEDYKEQFLKANQILKQNNFELKGKFLSEFGKNSKFQKDQTPLDNKCRIKELNKYSKSYLNHLIKSDEMLASMLISLHNIYFYQQFMREIRENITNGTFKSFYKKYINFFD